MCQTRRRNRTQSASADKENHQEPAAVNQEAEPTPKQRKQGSGRFPRVTTNFQEQQLKQVPGYDKPTTKFKWRKSIAKDGTVHANAGVYTFSSQSLKPSFAPDPTPKRKTGSVKEQLTKSELKALEAIPEYKQSSGHDHFAFWDKVIKAKSDNKTGSFAIAAIAERAVAGNGPLRPAVIPDLQYTADHKQGMRVPQIQYDCKQRAAGVKQPAHRLSFVNLTIQPGWTRGDSVAHNKYKFVQPDEIGLKWKEVYQKRNFERSAPGQDYDPRGKASSDQA